MTELHCFTVEGSGQFKMKLRQYQSFNTATQRFIDKGKILEKSVDEDFERVSFNYGQLHYEYTVMISTYNSMAN